MPYLGEALDSLRLQSYEDFEVLVVDDGSTDGTVETVESIDDDRFQLLRRDGDDGLAAALNHGIKASEGEFVARQDADDISHPDRFEEEIGFLRRNQHVAMVGTGAEIINESGESRGTRHVIESPSLEEIQTKNRFIHGSVMARKAVLEELGGYNESFEYSEDYDLWIRMAEDHSVRNIDESLYRLRLRSDSIYGDELETVKLYGRCAGRGTADINQIREEVDEEGLNREIAMELLRYGNPREARKYTGENLDGGVRDAETVGLHVLTYFPKPLIQSVARGYREVLNVRVKIRNFVAR